MIITCVTVVPLSMLKSRLTYTVLIKTEKTLAPRKPAGVCDMEDECSKLMGAQNKLSRAQMFFSHSLSSVTVTQIDSCELHLPFFASPN